MSFMKVKEEKN